MNDKAAALAMCALVRDTFRQSVASGIFVAMLVLTGVCVVLCLSVSIWGDVPLDGGKEPFLFLPKLPRESVVAAKALNPGKSAPVADAEFARREGVETLGGRMSIGFGLVTLPVSRERGDAVRFLELILGGGVAGTFGLLLALIWTAGFVPAFLDRAAAPVLLTKPVERRWLLAGKSVGVIVFVLFQVTLFVLATWLALGIRTGIWDMTYWWSVPLLVVQFAIFFSFSVFLGVVTRSSAACIFGAVLFWLVAWGINYGGVMSRELLDREYVPPGTLALADVAYWISPKPIDAGLLLFNSLDARRDFDKPEVFAKLETGRTFSPFLSIASSLLVAISLFLLAGREFELMDY
jgi:hypothetical protein